MNGNASSSSSPLTTDDDAVLNKPSAMELEPAIASSPPEQQSLQTPLGFLQSLWALLVAYAMYYKGVTSIVLSAVVILMVILTLDAVVSHVATRKQGRVHHLQHDYSALPSLYELKMAQIDHWCLHGGDNQCRCNDPTEPMPHEEVHGWVHAHSNNKQSIAAGADNNWDLVLLGDDLVEDYKGTVLGRKVQQLQPVAQYWNETFTINGGGDVDGVALGIKGDAISNLLWRIQHGELPQSYDMSDAKVYWIHIGTNDIGRDECSEEAVLLGILRLAEWLHQEKPYSVIVINSILPRMKEPSQKNGKKHSGSSSSSAEVVWAAIQEVNAQLQAFCVRHDHLVYFDATPLFVNSNLNKAKHAAAHTTLRSNMYEPDKFHLSQQGHETWGNAMLERLKLILYDDDESSN